MNNDYIKFGILGVCALGFILFGWGLGSIKEFFMHPSRALMMVTISALFALLPFMPELYKENSLEKEKKGEKGEKVVATIVLAFVIPFLIIAISAFSDRHDFMVMGSSNSMRYLGLFFLIIGAILIIRLPFQEGRFFCLVVRIKKNNRVSLKGTYKHIQFPNIGGLLGFMYGAVLIFRSFLGGILTVIAVLLILFKFEYKFEDILKEKFGNKPNKK